MGRTSIFCILAAAVLGLGMTLDAGAAQKEQPRTGGTMVFGLGKEPSNPNPFIATTSTTQYVKETTYESLLIRDDEDRIVPHLAEAYEVSAAGAVFTLRLRRGVKFHNGREMKADDVLWCVEHVRNPKNGALGHNLISNLKAAEKLDDYTVRLSLQKPSATFLSHLANIRMMPIVPANSLQPGQLKLEKNAFLPGTGPFFFEQYQAGFDKTVKRFPDYWGAPAHLDAIIFRTIADGTNRFNALRTGDVQMADRLAPLDLARIKKGQVKGIRVVEEPLGGFQHLVVNHLNPILRKREMRQAISYATDKQRLIEEVFFGAARPAQHMMDPAGLWGKAVALPPQKRDLARAKALLKEAGYNGQELVLIGRRGEVEFPESYRRMLGEAGIAVKLEIVEGGVMAERMIEGKYDLHIDGGSVTSDPVITMKPEFYTMKTEKGRYSNPKVDQLFDSLESEFDERKRLRTFRELIETLNTDVASIPLLFEARYVGMLDKVQDYGPLKGGNVSANGNYFKRVWMK